MPALRELQKTFVRALLAGDEQGLAGWIRDEGIPIARRLQIYRSNSRANFLATLRASYPVIERLGGVDWFAHLAHRYQARYPSRCGDLQYVGEKFPGFIEGEFAGTAYSYFADVARLEWAYQEVLTAAEAPPLALDRLAAVATADYGQLRFILHPALRTVASAFPVLAIWQANQPGDPADGTVDLAAGPAHVLLTRQRDHVELRECPPGLFALVRAVGSGRPLGAAAALASRVDASFDLAGGLQQLSRLGALSGFRADMISAGFQEEK